MKKMEDSNLHCFLWNWSATVNFLAIVACSAKIVKLILIYLIFLLWLKIFSLIEKKKKSLKMFSFPLGFKRF